VINALNAEVKRALADATVQERLRALDGQPAPSSSEELRTLLTRQIAIWTRVVDEAGIEKR
jgi:tripartite-type tricarboxylate transporter receptor subunit TctC